MSISLLLSHTLYTPKVTRFDFSSVLIELCKIQCGEALQGCLSPLQEFNTWVRKVENEYTEQQKRIPFTAEDLDLDRATITMLEDMGVIYEDRAKDNTTSYYMPEIFRTGLKFTSVKGARPRVLVLKRKALGIEVL